MAVLEDKDFSFISGSGAFVHCRWCHGRGCLACQEEYEKYMVERAKPIFTARTDNPREMAALKKVFGREALEQAFAPDGGGIQEVKINAAIQNMILLLHKHDDEPTVPPPYQPKRIQRKRTKGWRKPENCVIVSRPSIFGNPFSVEKYGMKEARDAYIKWMGGSILWPSLDEQREKVRVRLHELKGKDLACWCPEDAEWCHASELLEMANLPEAARGER